MATHCSIPAWEMPWTEEPGGLQSMESQRVRHDLGTKPLPPPHQWPLYRRSVLAQGRPTHSTLPLAGVNTQV